MESEKHRVIVQEIEQWRRNRLLPEQYCDFLQNLYRDPDEDTKQVFGIPAGKIVNARPRTWLLMIVFIGIICYIGFYFISFPRPMQIAVSALFVLGLYLVGTRQRNRRPHLSFVALWAGALAAPAAALYQLQESDASRGAYAILLLLVAAFWITTGIASRFAAFHFSGWGAIVLLYGWLLHHVSPDAGILRLQLGWLPVGALLGWVGTLLLTKTRLNGKVLLVSGAALWLAPEIYGLIATELSPVLLQTILTGKLAAAGIALYATRQKWIEWIG
ncbi:hypothetical protein [Gorillibacterium timonense]|uniref:hypothetical protein n=1 Tax=Gorillibacterium timonense TaxID=1689269 RepID=UPI00071E3E3F|nr:hypothetical protein [Gorillibacterium timonense]